MTCSREGKMTMIAGLGVARLLGLGLLLVGGSLATPALAQPAAAPAAAQPVDKAQETEALALFERGKEAYKNGKFTEAAALLESAYAKFPEPVLLYNLARAYEGTGEFVKAIDAYGRYLREAKDVPDRVAIEQRVQALEQNEAEKAKLQEERDAASRRAEDASRKQAQVTPSSPSPVPWIIAGVGVLGIGTGATLGAVALSKNDGRTQAEYVDNRPVAEDLALGSTVAFILGGVITGAGVVWGVIDVVMSDGGTEPAPVEARVVLGPGSVAIVGQF